MRARGITCVILLAITGCGDDGGGSAADAAPGDDSAATDASAGTLTLTTFVAGVPTPLAWVAMQDGDGDWQTVTSDDGVYSRELANRRWGIAYVCDGAEFDQLFVFNATLDDMTTLSRSCRSAAVPDTGTLTLQVNGLDSNGTAIVGFGNGGSLATMADPTATQSMLPVGTWEMPYIIKPDDTDIVRFGIATAALSANANVTLPVNATTSTVAVVNHVGAVTNATAPFGLGARFLSAGGSVVLLRQPAAQTYATVPAATLRAGDLHEVRANLPEGNSFRSVVTYFHEGRDVALELPDGLTATLEVAATTPYVQVSVSFSERAGAQLYMFDAHPFDLSNIPQEVRWVVTPAWLGVAETHTWVQPDFSGLPGFLTEWGIADDGRQIVWSHIGVATTGDSPLLEYFESPPETPWFNPVGDWDGDVVTFTRMSDITPPQ